MTEYIEREAAKAVIRSYRCSTDVAIDIEKRFDDIPAADVREVVTCIECKHSCDMPGGLRCCYGTCVDCYVDPEFFCAAGEKRKES